MGTFERIKQISPWFFGVFAVLLVLFFTIGDRTVVDAMRQRISNNQFELGYVGDIMISRQDFNNQVQEASDRYRRAGQEVEYAQINNQVWQSEVNKALIQMEADSKGIGFTIESLKDIMWAEPPHGIQKNFPNAEGGFDHEAYLRVLGDIDYSVTEMLRANYAASPNIQKLMEQDPTQAQQAIDNAVAEEAPKVIEQYRNLFKAYEDSITMFTPRAAYMNLVSEAASVVSPAFAKEQYKFERSTADVVYMPFSANNYRQNIEVTDAEIEAYYNDNKEDYIVKEDRVKVDFLVIPFTPLKSDSAKAMKYIASVTEALDAADSAKKNEVYSSMITKYFGSEITEKTNAMNRSKGAFLKSMKVGDISKATTIGDSVYFFRLDAKDVAADSSVEARHILLKTDMVKTQEEFDSLQTLAKDLIAQLKGGADFAEMARKYSQDQGSAIKGGDLGFFTRGRMVAPFEKACFDKFATKGLVEEPVGSQFGFHIIDVTDSKVEIPDTTARVVKFAQIVFTPEISEKSLNSFKRLSRQIAKRLKAGENLDSIGKENGIMPGSTRFVTSGASLMVQRPERINNRFFVDSAFVAEKGYVFTPKNYDKCVVVAQVADKQAKGSYMTLEDVSATCKNEVLKEKRMELAKADAESSFNKVKSFGSLAAAKAADSTLNIMEMANFRYTSNAQGVTRDPLFNAKIMVEGSQSMNILEGDNGYYIIEVKNAKMPTEQQVEEGYVSYIPNLSNRYRNQAFNNWYNELFRKMLSRDEIKDYRYKYSNDY